MAIRGAAEGPRVLLPDHPRAYDIERDGGGDLPADSLNTTVPGRPLEARNEIIWFADGV